MNSKSNSNGNSNATEKKNQPVHEERIGAIKAVVWANHTKAGGTMHNTTIARIYKDADGNWQESPSLGRDDLLVAAKVLDRVHSWLTTKEPERPAS